MELRYLDDAEQQQLKNYEKLFEQPGYQSLMQRAEELVNGLTAQLMEAESLAQLKYLRGRIDQLKDLLSYETFVMTQFEMVINQRKEDQLEIEDSKGANL